MQSTIVDLIRHGEPQGGSMYRGHNIDDPLSEKGWQQMWHAVNDNNHWQQIISSPMLRCEEFAQQLSDKHDIPLQIENDFKEVGFGAWEGLTRDQVKQKNIDEYNNFYLDPVSNRPESFEPLDNFINRVTQTYEKVIKQYENQHILIVAHAGVIRALLAYIVYAPAKGIYNFKINNAGVSQIDASSRDIIFINQ